MSKPMSAPVFEAGDEFWTVTGWHGRVVKRHAHRARGYKVEWLDTKGHQFAKPGDMCDLTPLNMLTAWEPRPEQRG